MLGLVGGGFTIPIAVWVVITTGTTLMFPIGWVIVGALLVAMAAGMAAGYCIGRDYLTADEAVDMVLQKWWRPCMAGALVGGAFPYVTVAPWIAANPWSWY
jgi:hypothetical protein